MSTAPSPVLPATPSRRAPRTLDPHAPPNPRTMSVRLHCSEIFTTAYVELIRAGTAPSEASAAVFSEMLREGTARALIEGWTREELLTAIGALYDAAAAPMTANRVFPSRSEARA